MGIRTFIALELPPALKSRLGEIIERYSRLSPPGVNWVPPQNIHMTLVFIGEVEQTQIAELDEVITRLLRGFPPLNFTAEGLELFPSRDPRMLWLKLSAENDDIYKLQKRLIREVLSLGISPDRKPLKLHVTLARLKTALSPELASELMSLEFKPESLALDSLCLFRSVLLPQGPNYSIIENYTLK